MKQGMPLTNWLMYDRFSSSDTHHDGRLMSIWRIAFAPVWDYSSVDGLVAYDHASPVFKAYGYEHEESFEDLKDDAEFQTEMLTTKGYLYVDTWPFAIVRFGAPTDPPYALENLLTSLKIKVESMNSSENRGYKLGYEALETWRQGLLDEAWYQTADQESLARRLVDLFKITVTFNVP